MGWSFSKEYKVTSRIDGKTVVVTGCNTGIGKFTAQELYRVGGRVIMACRDVAKAELAAEDIRKNVFMSDPGGKFGELVIKKLDLASIESIRSCAEDLLKSEQQINILINNAGVYSSLYEKTADGFEMQFATNYLGPFYLTYLLLPKILMSTPARIVNVSSYGHTFGRMNWDDLNNENYPCRRLAAEWQYAHSKLALVLFSRELASRVEGSGVTVYSLHPGFISTEIGRHHDNSYFNVFSMVCTAFKPFVKSIEAGAATTLYCALDQSLANESGFYYSDCAKKNPAPQACRDEDAKRLWYESLKLLGLQDLDLK